MSSACWGITSGSAGMEAQVKALAASIDVVPVMKKITIRQPFAALPNACFPGLLDRFVIPHMLAAQSDALLPPWPELVISCGRRGAIAALGLKRAMQGKGFFIHIQDPHVNPKHFDLVVAMAHDRLQSDHVISTEFALHAITPDALAQAREHFAPRFAAYPSPRIAVLLGGSTNKYTLTTGGMAQIIAALQRLPGSLLITPSRRTGEENIALLEEAFPSFRRRPGSSSPLAQVDKWIPACAGMTSYIYDSTDENPYLGLLALADAIVVTDDSVNMMSEAAATGKPLYILPLPGHANTKPARFAQMLIARGIARELNGVIERWAYAIPNEMEMLAAEVKRRLALA